MGWFNCVTAFRTILNDAASCERKDPSDSGAEEQSGQQWQQKAMRFAIGQRRARTLRRWGSAGWPTRRAGPAEPVKGMDTFVVLLTLDDDDLYGAEDDD